MIKRKEFIHTGYKTEVHETEGKKRLFSQKKRKVENVVRVPVLIAETMYKISKFLEMTPKKTLISIQEQEMKRFLSFEPGGPDVPSTLLKFVIFYHEEEVKTDGEKTFG